MDTRSQAEIDANEEKMREQTEKRGLDSLPEPNNTDEIELKKANDEMTKTLQGPDDVSEVTAPDRSKTLNLSQKIGQLLSRIGHR